MAINEVNNLYKEQNLISWLIWPIEGLGPLRSWCGRSVGGLKEGSSRRTTRLSLSVSPHKGCSLLLAAVMPLRSLIDMPDTPVMGLLN